VQISNIYSGNSTGQGWHVSYPFEKFIVYGKHGRNSL
jgi:hypothetical protein